MTLYNLTIPPPFCCFLAGFFSIRVAMETVAPLLPWWGTLICGAIAVWSIVSWRWRHVVRTAERAALFDRIKARGSFTITTP